MKTQHENISIEKEGETVFFKNIHVRDKERLWECATDNVSP